MGVGGTVGIGESYEQALYCEAQEELNLDLTVLPWRELGYFSPMDTLFGSFQRIYEIRTDDVPDFNPDDYSGGEWMTPAKLRWRTLEGEPAKGDRLALLAEAAGVSLSECAKLTARKMRSRFAEHGRVGSETA